YASLVRLQQRGWISAAWGVSDNNRKAKYYSITKAGKRQMKAERTNWERLSAVIGRVLAAGLEGAR
ncbi:MAG: helix-turn-helix transcriptional regulator, partial [Acidobacteriia bacterium]|nr:helix-turn-helix transcriptional regulator [Terriglobia bacterium]